MDRWRPTSGIWDMRGKPRAACRAITAPGSGEVGRCRTQRAQARVCGKSAVARAAGLDSLQRTEVCYLGRRSLLRHLAAIGGTIATGAGCFVRCCLGSTYVALPRPMLVGRAASATASLWLIGRYCYRWRPFMFLAAVSCRWWRVLWCDNLLWVRHFIARAFFATAVLVWLLANAA